MIKSLMLGAFFVSGLIAIVLGLALVGSAAPGIASDGVSPLVSLRMN